MPPFCRQNWLRACKHYGDPKLQTSTQETIAGEKYDTTFAVSKKMLGQSLYYYSALRHIHNLI
jgi:hypothetical protein